LVESLAELERMDQSDSILILAGNLATTPLMPKNYPFYYPDEHKYIIELLEAKAPLAIIALTGRHPMCGLAPFPLFEDGNFRIPAAYASRTTLPDWQEHLGENVMLKIDSQMIPAKGRQLVASKTGTGTKDRVVVGAHMDTKYQTLGALDNAVGVAVLLEAAKELMLTEFSVDVVPFNGEEYFAASGELAYVNYLKQRTDAIRLMINIDSPCFKGSPNAVSCYNLSGQDKDIVSRTLAEFPAMVAGEPWHAGDHAVFSFTGTPCIAVSTSDFKRALALTHTRQDTLEVINLDEIIPVADAVVQFVRAIMGPKEP
jgi:aminopeptidase YwaD